MPTTEPTVDARGRQQIVVVGAGYAGLHVAQRMSGWLKRHRDVQLTLVDKQNAHQIVVEFPRVATGTRQESDVSIALDSVLQDNIRFIQATVTGFDLVHHNVLTETDSIPFDVLVLAAGSRPNDFDIPGLAEHVLYAYTAPGALEVWDAVTASVRRAGEVADRQEQQRLLTVVIGGGGATGVELAGGFAEELPALAHRCGAPTDLIRVILVEAGPTILAGSSPELIHKARTILSDLAVEVQTNAEIAEATSDGLRLKSGEVITGGVYVWAGGIKAASVLTGSGLEIDHNGRVKVDQYLRALDHEVVYVAGDAASVLNPETGRPLPPLAQIALDEADTVVHNIEATMTGKPLESFAFRTKGFVVSVGERKGVADIAGLTIGGRLARALKDSIEWEYRQSVKRLRGWGAA